MKNDENPFSVEHAEDSSGFLLWKVTTLWRRGIEKALEPLELTHPQFVLLASVYWLTLQEKEVTQVLLATHTTIDVMTTSTVLRTLQKKGFVQRQEHQKDTRAKIVQLTATGKELVNKAVKVVEQYDHDFFAVLGKQAKDFNQKIALLLQ